MRVQCLGATCDNIRLQAQLARSAQTPALSPPSRLVRRSKCLKLASAVQATLRALLRLCESVHYVITDPSVWRLWSCVWYCLWWSHAWQHLALMGVSTPLVYFYRCSAVLFSNASPIGLAKIRLPTAFVCYNCGTHLSPKDALVTFSGENFQGSGWKQILSSPLLFLLISLIVTRDLCRQPKYMVIPSCCSPIDN